MINGLDGKRLLYRTDLHVHTQVSGHAQGSVEDYIRKAKSLGLNCLGFTEHVGPNFQGAPFPVYFQGFANRYPSRVEGLAILKGAEVNINNFNELDLSLEIIKLLDYIIASVHLGVGKIKDLGIGGNTLRVITCLENFGKYIDILGHPYLNCLEIDLEKVIPVAVKAGVIIEVNLSVLEGNKMSFEKAQEIIKITREHNGLLVVNTDAHNIHELGVLSKTKMADWLDQSGLLSGQDVVSLWDRFHLENYFRSRRSQKQ